MKSPKKLALIDRKKLKLTRHAEIVDPVEHELWHQNLELLVAVHVLILDSDFGQIVHFYHGIKFQLQHDEEHEYEEVTFGNF